MKRLLVVGYGDIAHRTAALLPKGVELRAVSRSTGFDLDRPETLAALGGWADIVLHYAPPPVAGTTDPRTTALLASLETGGILPRRLVYISTSGVYGDCGGALVDESRPVNPQTARAVRRVDAENQLIAWDYEGFSFSKGGRPNGNSAANVISGELVGLTIAAVAPNTAPTVPNAVSKV